MIDPEQARLSAPKPSTGSKTAKVFLASLMLLVAISFLFFFLNRSPPSVILLPQENPFPTPSSDLDHLKNRLSHWGWLIRDRLLGPRKAILLDGFVLKFPQHAASTLPSESFPSPTLESTNGIKVWLVAEEEMPDFRKKLIETTRGSIFFQPRIRTSDGVKSSFFVGASTLINGLPIDQGFTAEVLPRIYSGGAHLTISLTSTEDLAKQSDPLNLVATNLPYLGTNFAVAARVHLPKQTSLFFLIPGKNSTYAESHGVLLTVKHLRPNR